MEDTQEYTKRCDVTGRMYHDCAIRSCHHPAVLKKYGFNGKCAVSIYVCKKCKYAEKDPHMDAYGCTFQNDK